MYYSSITQSVRFLLAFFAASLHDTRCGFLTTNWCDPRLWGYRANRTTSVWRYHTRQDPCHRRRSSHGNTSSVCWTQENKNNGKLKSKAKKKKQETTQNDDDTKPEPRRQNAAATPRKRRAASSELNYPCTVCQLTTWKPSPGNY